MNTHHTSPHTINIGGQLTSLERPLVMGILNATTESFYTASQVHTAKSIANRALTILAEGATILDVGGCSTKPGLDPVSEKEEMKRLAFALESIREAAPQAVISVDTFRASIARKCVEEYGVQIINDVYGGEADKDMFDAVADLQVPYILTAATSYDKLAYSLAKRIDRLRLMGVNDVIVDPGFGFGKSFDENYRLMAHLEDLRILHCPLLVGVSRKSMVYNLLDSQPEEALNGTTALHTIALMKGAHILRAHDVRAAVETVKITEKLKEVTNS